MTMPKTLGHSILSMRDRSPTNIAIKFKKQGCWLEKKWADYFKDVETIGSALSSMGIKYGDRVAIMACSRYEWSVADLAILGIRAVTVPIYPNNTADDVEYILNNSESRILICENSHTFKIFESVKANCPTIEKVIVMDKAVSISDVLSWQELEKTGQTEYQKKQNHFQKLCGQILPSDTATLLYTSGTTGRPKGVVLTHRQIYSEVSEAFPLCGANESDTTLSFLPYAHILGRIEHWGHLYIGFTMAYAESIERMRHNLTDIRPTFLVAVPRIFEKIHATIWAQTQTQPLKLKLFNWALSIGQKVGEYKMSGQVLPIDLLVEYQIAKTVALDKIKETFGGRLRFAISGGAPLSKEISIFFHSSNILILEGYGLTETTAAITVNTPFNYRFGSVGRPIGEVQLKIAEDGEILVKSDKVMTEYYKDIQATKTAIEDGWFHTGDIGEILASGDLKITDRKKDLIKTAGGKYVAPQKLEGLLKNSPYIAHVHIHGDQKKYVVALITLDRLNVEQLAKSKNIIFADWAQLIQSKFIQEHIHSVVADVNSQLASFESIKKYKILPNEFSVEGGELTPSLKVKRKVIDHRFQSIIEKLYH